jgi:hypothetical protein
MAAVFVKGRYDFISIRFGFPMMFFLREELSTGFLRENGPAGCSSERRVPVGNSSLADVSLPPGAAGRWGPEREE